MPAYFIASIYAGYRAVEAKPEFKYRYLKLRNTRCRYFGLSDKLFKNKGVALEVIQGLSGLREFIHMRWMKAMFDKPVCSTGGEDKQLLNALLSCFAF